MRFVALLILFISGCRPGTDRDEYVPYSDNYVRSFLMREISLKDGTRCVLYGESGITCDWSEPIGSDTSEGEE
jgi:hypothetical protein